MDRLTSIGGGEPLALRPSAPGRGDARVRALGVLFRRGRGILLVFAGVLAVATAATLLRKPRYDAQASDRLDGPSA